MTVDNTAEKSWYYDFSAVLSTQEVHPCPNIGAVCTKKAAAVDNYSKMLKLQLQAESIENKFQHFVQLTWHPADRIFPGSDGGPVSPIPA